MSATCDQNAWVHPGVVFDGTAHVGFSSCVGYGTPVTEETYIGAGVRIGAFCVIELGVHIEADVQIDHYCRIARGARIGAKTRILYGAQVFDDVKIGRDCIIGGDLVDRTIVGDEVTFQGNTAHSHRDPTGDWDETEEPSPVIEWGSVVGIGALLIGGIRIGPRAFVAAGEIVKCDVPKETVLQGGKLQPLSDFRGMVKVRGNHERIP
jgi:UDP-3-O-[3-hydroxymyristoyl] glucosamine N-acyltransferase